LPLGSLFSLLGFLCSSVCSVYSVVSLWRTTMDAEHQDLDERIKDLRNRAGDCLDRCQFRSAYRLYGELRRLARGESRVIPFLQAFFPQRDIAQDLIEPMTTREMSLELIALLEHEERARVVQPDFPEGEYEFTQGWMTACAYENFAEATGQTEGYNSEGMHGCITDGIQVCR